MGAVTVTVTNTDYLGSRRLVIGTLTMSNSYTSGGDTYTPGQFGLESVDSLNFDDMGLTNTTTGISVGANVVYPTGTGFSATGGAIQAFGAGTGSTGITQIAANTNLSAYVAVYQAVGW